MRPEWRHPASPSSRPNRTAFQETVSSLILPILALYAKNLRLLEQTDYLCEARPEGPNHGWGNRSRYLGISGSGVLGQEQVGYGTAWRTGSPKECSIPCHKRVTLCALTFRSKLTDSRTRSEGIGAMPL